MSDNKRLNVPLTYVKTGLANTSGSATNIQYPNSARGAASTFVVPQNITSSLGATYVAADRKLSRSRDVIPPAEQPTVSKEKIEKTGRALISLTLMRIVNRKMFDHFHTVKDQKRKGMLKRTFLKTLAMLEHDRTNYHKAYAWMALLKNCYHLDKALTDKATKGVEKAKESNVKKCCMILKRRYVTLLKFSVERIKKNSKRIGLLQSPVSILSHMFQRKMMIHKAYSLLKIKLQAYKKKNQFKIGSIILKNLFNSKLLSHLTHLRVFAAPGSTSPQQPLTASTSRITITPGKGSRVTTTTTAQVTTPTRKPPTKSTTIPQPSEQEKLNARLQELNKEKQSLNAKGQEEIATVDEQIQALEQKIAEEEEKKKESQKVQQQHLEVSSPAKSVQTTGDSEKDPYYQVLRTIYEFTRAGPDSIRKRDIIQKFELDLSQLEDTVQHQLDRNQQLKDTINNIEDFLCPDQAIERPELQIDEANRLLEHENSQLRKVLQRYLVESYGKNLLEESKKVCAMLSDRLAQQKAQ